MKVDSRKTQPLLQGLLQAPALQRDDGGVRAERKAGRPSPCPCMEAVGMDVNRKVQGVGLGPVEGKGEGGSWPLLLPVVRGFCSNCPSYDEQSKVQGSHEAHGYSYAAGRGSQTLLGAQGSPPPRAAFSSLCLESAQGEFVS